MGAGMQRAVIGWLAACVLMGTAFAQPASLPQAKQTKLGLYVTAKEAFDLKQREGAKALFVDVRSRAEAAFVGMPSVADALVPLTEPAFEQWDEGRGNFATPDNQAFRQELARRLAERGLGKDDTLIVMCRSGDRSARAINEILVAEGYTKAYSVVDGFEGDMSKDGRRSVNGWKNAGLPWTYKVDKAKLPQPAKGR